MPHDGYFAPEAPQHIAGRASVLVNFDQLSDI
jgi:hypothetical protein